MSYKILVTGANGQLGMELRDLAQNQSVNEFVFVAREDLDITDRQAVNQYFSNGNFSHCINCAAYTAVDKAEQEKEQALKANADAVGYLAAACKEHSVRFIHISTDYVFNGTSTVPYETDAPTDPVNFYGETKLQGENKASQNNPASVIIRTSWVYSSHGKNFVKTMLRLMSEKESIGVVADQKGSPTYAADLAEAIMQIVNAKDWKPGVYHYSNQGIISWHQFASAIQKISGKECLVNAIATSDYPTPAARPAYSAFETKKIREAYGIEIPVWEDSLRKCLAKLS